MKKNHKYENSRIKQFAAILIIGALSACGADSSYTTAIKVAAAASSSALTDSIARVKLVDVILSRLLFRAPDAWRSSKNASSDAGGGSAMLRAATITIDAGAVPRVPRKTRRKARERRPALL